LEGRITDVAAGSDMALHVVMPWSDLVGLVLLVALTVSLTLVSLVHPPPCWQLPIVAWILPLAGVIDITTAVNGSVRRLRNTLRPIEKHQQKGT